VAVTIGLLVWRGDTLASPRRITAPVSREAAFLANNVVFAAFAFTVLLGTVFPLLAEAFQGERITVGSPFFNRMSVPVGLTLLVLMAVAPVLPWGRASAERVAERLQWPAWAGGLAAVGAVAVGNRGVSTVVAFALGGFAAGAAVRQLVLSVRRHGARGLTGRSNGGMVVHLGVVAVAVAVAASQSYVQQTELRLDEGASADFAGHTLTYVGPTERIESARTLRQALVVVDGRGPYAPGEATFPFGEQRVGVPSVRTTLTNDIALSVLAWPEEPGGAVTIRVTAQPLIVWLWIGGGIMVLGTALAIAPHRRPSSTGLSARDGGADGDLAGGTESADRAVSTTVGSDAGVPSS
jgi:cytochrome c-type biogenesis protein CcmF